MADESDAQVAEVFNLMDTRGFGRINLEAFFEFTDCLPDPPPHEEVAALYQKFDDDGSGDIDAHEFNGLCAALERLVGMDTREIIEAYTRCQYIKLFELVDEDGGGTIDRQELKAVVEPLQGILGLKTSAADVAIIFRNMGKEELDFDDFLIVMRKIAQGRPIGQVVRAFQFAQKRSSEQKQQATLVFDEGKRRAHDKSRGAEEDKIKTPPFAKASRPCMVCVRKELEIQELRDRIDRLERESQVSELQEREHPPSLEPQIRDAIAKPDVAATLADVFPGALKAALHQTRASRVRGIALQSSRTPTDALAKELATVADAAHKAQLQLQGVVAPMVAAVQEIIAVKSELMELVCASPPTDFFAQSGLLTEMLGKVQANRSIAQSFAEDAGWALEQVAAHRSAASDIALAGAPHSSAPHKLMEAIVAAEEATQAAVEMCSIALYFGTDNPCEVEEMLERALSNSVRAMSAEVIDAMQSVIRMDRDFFARGRWEQCCGQLKETMYRLQAQGTSFVTRTKDRGCNTAPVDYIEPLGAPIALVRRQDPVAPQLLPGSLSRPPRQHKKRREVVLSQRLVDGIVQKALRRGAPVPSNFHRVQLSDHHDAVRHVFQFGTKRVDLVVVDEALMVHVGGGFLTFREFCDKYAAYEQGRIDREAEREAVLQANRDSTSPNPSMAQQVFQSALRSSSRHSRSPGW